MKGRLPLAIVCAGLIACATAAPRARRPVSHADESWRHHPRALLLLVSDPRPYLTILNAFPFQLRIALLERAHHPGRFGGAYWPIGPSTEGETAWTGELPLTIFLNTDRFVETGYLGLRATGMTRVPNPLRRHCPSDLVQAAVVDMDGRNLRILEVRRRLRDERYGCIYSFRFITDDP